MVMSQNVPLGASAQDLTESGIKAVVRAQLARTRLREIAATRFLPWLCKLLSLSFGLTLVAESPTASCGNQVPGKQSDSGCHPD